MPNVKAPEYYKVSGGSPPKIPDVDEKKFLMLLRPPSERAPKNFNAVSKNKTKQQANNQPPALESEG